jgi:hypothetical protein
MEIINVGHIEQTQKHTPGPWNVYHENGSMGSNGCWGVEGKSLMVENKKTAIAVMARTESTRANARLIAAAPELLEAINHAISEIDNHIAQNPSAKTLLPELRTYLATRRDKAIGEEGKNETLDG